MARVTLRGVKKVYDGGIVAVASFSLDVADKEFVVLVGPSGCGKSTVLRMVAGLEALTEGELLLDGQLVNNVPPHDRDVAMVFQNYALYPHMTAYENMAFALRLRNLPKGEIDRRVRAAAALLDMTEYLRRKPAALSGGQRQRVAIGRAVVRQPQVFLMDEPLSNLDAKLRNQMRAEIIQLHRSIDTTFLYVTHDQAEAMTLGERIVLMKDGHILQVGTPRQLYHQPVNLFAAGFIGTPPMNFYAARLTRADGGYAIACLDTVLPCGRALSNRLSERGVADGPVTLGIRPEHIAPAEGDGPGVIPARILRCERMGSEVYLHTVTGTHSSVVRVPTHKLPTRLRQEGIVPGMKLHFTLPPAHMHLFDPTSEQNITQDPVA